MLKRLGLLFINTVFTVLILIYLILEELVWERIAEPIYRFLHSLKILQRLEGVIHGLNRYTILIIFLLLFVIVEGLGIVAIGFFANGLPIIGMAIYAAKIPITAITFWLFKVAKDKLMTFGWFLWCYDGLQAVILKIKTSRIYINIKTRMHNIKVWIKAIFSSAPVQRIRAMLGFKAN
ncbi:hypothetical protein MCAMS1_02390 [biofilm metagenome]